MDKDKQNNEETNNLGQDEDINDNIDFDSMFDDEDITTWGVFNGDDRIALYEMHSGK